MLSSKIFKIDLITYTLGCILYTNMYVCKWGIAKKLPNISPGVTGKIPVIQETLMNA